ncbi:MAG: MarR family transcriptional regulator [Bacteroidetes bacterium]|nr:MarR family transcriptional regulator [Bacteroidota bacterium]
MKEVKSSLLLEDQLCFPLYASSHMITRMYQPYLKEIGLTYPQYIVMLVLWENRHLTIGELGEKLFLNSNTLSPLISKMKEKGLLTKQRSSTDERTLEIALTHNGKKLRTAAEAVPQKLLHSLKMPIEELLQMRTLLWKFLKGFEKR